MKQRKSLWINLIIYWLLSFFLLSVSMVNTQGHFGYPLDDTYIHMAMGKHFIEDGFWGVSQNGFSSSTSSPLWTFLIAFSYKIFGINDWIPFALGLLCGSTIIVVSYGLLKNKTNPFRLTIFLAIIIFFTPLSIMTLLGMEHVIHGLLTILLIYSATSYLAKNDQSQLTYVLLLSGLVTMARYEGLFLVFTIALLFFISKRYSALLFIVGAGLLPITVYGIYSIMRGWFFFPTSILLKGNSPVLTLEGISLFLGRIPFNLTIAPHLMILIIACLGIYLWGAKQGVLGKNERNLVTVFILTALLHTQFANIGWFYRYESYLVLTGSVILIDMICSHISYKPVKISKSFDRAAVIALVLLMMMPLAVRAGNAFRDYPLAVLNIFEQQYQMGIFLREHYTGKSIAANDIGAINYLANIKTLDLYGLGSIEVTQAKRNGSYNKVFVDELVSAHNVEIIVIYTSWFEGNIPSEWVEVGRWQIANNIVAGDNTVSFYAPNVSLEKDIIANLQEFADRLPPAVKQSGVYVTP